MLDKRIYEKKTTELIQSGEKLIFRKIINGKLMERVITPTTINTTDDNKIYISVQNGYRINSDIENVENINTNKLTKIFKTDKVSLSSKDGTLAYVIQSLFEMKFILCELR